ncbi:hypothetical protein [Cellulomonas phragmiteti]|uniref:DUF4352 domain-containing protein n=1 Tax=Cellulomonas phragmiteti TaxID=478780 RepID=A0ABQ4DI29_9CELL|nr:hypothetical protein [Cellulomonas phragmiteti]GIG38662.1 hypothetical protein Cph01nite_04240 [Cellulomonas phragmiteti]
MGLRRLVKVVTGALLVTSVLVACTASDDAEPQVAGTVDVATPSESARSPQPDATSSASSAPEPGDGSAPAPGELPTMPPVGFADAADFGTGVTAEVVRVDPIEAEGRGPGELSGPALAFRVEVSNDSAAPVDLASVTVNVTDAAGAPGAPLSGPPAAPFTGAVDPGGSATGTYVFLVPDAARDQVVLEVSYSTDASVVVFSGSPDDARPRS